MMDLNSETLKFQSKHGIQRCSVCDPAKIIFTSKFSYLSFCKPPPIKLKLGWQTGMGDYSEQTTWTNHYGEPIKNIEQTSIIYITLSPAGAQQCCAYYYYEPQESVQFAELKTSIIFMTLVTADAQLCCAFYYEPQESVRFAELNRHILTFLHPILQCMITYSTEHHRWRWSQRGKM